MSIADKLTTIAENVPKVYEAGQKSMVDESKIIPKTVAGKRFVAVDDVSEIPHDVEISVSSDCDVMVYGKNLCEPITDGITSNGITVTKNEDNTFTANGTATALTQIILSKDIFVINGLTYYLFGSETELVSFQWQCRKSGSTVKTLNPSTNNSVSVTGDDTFNTIRCLLRIPSGTTLDNVVFKPTISFINDLKSETYIEPSEYTTQNGTAIVKSLSPYMTVIADSEVDITMNYRKSYGMQTEYDRFWDAYQENGNRTNYRLSFSGVGWGNATFIPKYNMDNISNAYGMFWTCGITGDLVEILKNLNISFDSSKATQYHYMFAECKFTRVGEINATGSNNLTSMFSTTSNLKTVDKLILKEDGSNTFSTAFNAASALENITIEGTIGNNLDIHWSPLTHDSIMSIINHLQTKTSGTFTLTLGSTNLAKLTDAEKAIATSRGWTLA